MVSTAPSYRVILCGEYGVGKSSVFRRFSDNKFTMASGPTSTIGLDTYDKSFTYGGSVVKVQMWDTGGMERLTSLSPSYYKGAHAALVCYSLADRESFDNLSQYIMEIVVNAEKAKIFLVGNKCDLASLSEDVTEEDIEEFQMHCDILISSAYRVSCKTGEGVHEMFEDMARVLYDSSQDYFDRSRNAGYVDLEDYDDEKKVKCCK